VSDRAEGAVGAAARRFGRRRALLAIGVASPLFAFVVFVVGVLAYPGFDHARQYISELGGAYAAFPQIFNYGILLSGLGCVAAGVGFAFAVRGLGGGRAPAVLTALSFAAAGVGLVVASLYPWPDVRHRFINLGLGIQLAPLFLIWGLARVPDTRRLRLFLGVVFLLMTLLAVITRHLVFPGLVHDENVGWWERTYAFVLVSWSAVVAFILERRLWRIALTKS
jgi:hypothetical membrane protein